MCCVTTVLTNIQTINCRTKSYNYIIGEDISWEKFQCIMLYLSSNIGDDILSVILSNGCYRTMIEEEGMTAIYSIHFSF